LGCGLVHGYFRFNRSVRGGGLNAHPSQNQQEWGAPGKDKSVEP
jgi:hypothetical protein